MGSGGHHVGMQAAPVVSLPLLCSCLSVMVLLPPHRPLPNRCSPALSLTCRVLSNRRFLGVSAPRASLSPGQDQFSAADLVLQRRQSRSSSRKCWCCLSICCLWAPQDPVHIHGPGVINSIPLHSQKCPSSDHKLRVAMLKGKCGCREGGTPCWVTQQAGDGMGMGPGLSPPGPGPRGALPPVCIYLHLASFRRGFEAVTPPQSLIPPRYHLPPLNHRSLELPLVKAAWKCNMPIHQEHALIPSPLGI